MNNISNQIQRPSLNKENIDRTEPSFVRIVDEYYKWSSAHDSVEREELEKDIINCILSYYIDGFELAKELERDVHITGDSELVDILDGISYTKDRQLKILIGKWVKDNNLTIPDDVIGKKVCVTQNFRTYNNHFITKIKPETYEVCISDKIDTQGGFIIKYENIKFV